MSRKPAPRTQEEIHKSLNPRGMSTFETLASGYLIIEGGFDVLWDGYQEEMIAVRGNEVYYFPSENIKWCERCDRTFVPFRDEDDCAKFCTQRNKEKAQ